MAMKEKGINIESWPYQLLLEWWTKVNSSIRKLEILRSSRS